MKEIVLILPENPSELLNKMIKSVVGDFPYSIIRDASALKDLHNKKILFALAKEKDENKFELYMFNVMNPGILASEKTQTYLTIRLFKKDNTSENVIRMYELNKGFYIDHHETCLITKENLKEFNKSIENLLKDYLLELNEKENKDKKRKEESMKAIKDLQ